MGRRSVEPVAGQSARAPRLETGKSNLMNISSRKKLRRATRWITIANSERQSLPNGSHLDGTSAIAQTLQYVASNVLSRRVLDQPLRNRSATPKPVAFARYLLDRGAVAAMQMAIDDR
jgi:hypothetical protein